MCKIKEFMIKIIVIQIIDCSNVKHMRSYVFHYWYKNCYNKVCVCDAYYVVKQNVMNVGEY